MKAITIMQPWAWLIIHGHKRVENRTWPTKFRGPLLIHAGKGKQWIRDPAVMAELRRLVPGLPAVKDLVFGAIVGRVDMVDCLKLEAYRVKRKIERLGRDPFAKGPWCHVYEQAEVIEPVACGGNLSLWDASEVMQAHGIA